jgi:hypothetical protein
MEFAIGFVKRPPVLAMGTGGFYLRVLLRLFRSYALLRRLRFRCRLWKERPGRYCDNDDTDRDEDQAGVAVHRFGVFEL